LAFSLKRDSIEIIASSSAGGNEYFDAADYLCRLLLGEAELLRQIDGHAVAVLLSQRWLGEAERKQYQAK